MVQRMEIAEGLVLDKTTAPIGVLLIIFEVGSSLGPGAGCRRSSSA